MAGGTSSSRLPAAEGGPALTFRPPVTPAATQFLDRMGRGWAASRPSRAEAHETLRAGGFTGSAAETQLPAREQRLWGPAMRLLTIARARRRPGRAGPRPGPGGARRQAHGLARRAARPRAGLRGRLHHRLPDQRLPAGRRGGGGRPVALRLGGPARRRRRHHPALPPAVRGPPDRGARQVRGAGGLSQRGAALSPGLLAAPDRETPTRRGAAGDAPQKPAKPKPKPKARRPVKRS